MHPSLENNFPYVCMYVTIVILCASVRPSVRPSRFRPTHVSLSVRPSVTYSTLTKKRTCVACEKKRLRYITEVWSTFHLDWMSWKKVARLRVTWWWVAYSPPSHTPALPYPSNTSSLPTISLELQKRALENFLP